MHEPAEGTGHSMAGSIYHPYSAAPLTFGGRAAAHGPQLGGHAAHGLPKAVSGNAAAAHTVTTETFS
ncbi:hypothetical protein J2Z21_008276 [Streptomyces griseochromogenes]|uniref:Uncharacterized protein n=1 Tax=Streptomyces griseochromogenes TaxID=68214 RepID=A0ABS4M728_9ACTN|nr:hypothetical protein [Streptomyces griseochromogenes]